MPSYVFVISDASTGNNLAELPLSGVSFSRVLSGVGTLTGSLDVWHPAATKDILGFGSTGTDREITVFRDDNAVWNGPLGAVQGGLSSGELTLTASEASAYFGQRVLEVNKNYDGFDYFDIVRDLDDYMETKEATGDDGMTLGDDIVAAIPRFSVIASMAGATFSDPSPPTFYGSARHTIAECLEAFTDPEDGFEWRMLYTGSTRTSVQRLLDLAYPAFTDVAPLTLTDSLIDSIDISYEWDQAGTRVHAVGYGFTKTLQSSAAVSAGSLLSEVVDDVTHLRNHDLITGYAKDMRRLRRPPARTFSVSVTPSDKGVSFYAVNVGNVVALDIQSLPPVFRLSAGSRRVVQLTITPESAEAAENLAFTFNVRADDLSA